MAVQPIDSRGPAGAAPGAGANACFHCGLPCGSAPVVRDDKPFCCAGCATVFGLLQQSGLGQFYDLQQHPGLRTTGRVDDARWAFLDTPELQKQLLDFTDGRQSRVTFRVPGIHCIACVWLLENLFRLHPGIGQSQVNFPRREVSITFATERLRLSELVALLVSIGYEPALTLGELDKPPADPAWKRRVLQVGVAGFAFGNIMLFSLPLYLGLDSWSGPRFRLLFGGLSLLLALPVLIYSASDYWRAAWVSYRQRTLTLDVPIALGLAALYLQSAWEIGSGRGEGYLDSLAGLVFFLLCGRAFQQKTHDRLAFDRDYRSFFPLSVNRRGPDGAEAHVALSTLNLGDRLVLRHGELIPADATLESGEGLIDYSFVTGEAEPVPRQPGDHLYAGGRQVGGRIEVTTVKAVSQSYLTSLWSHDAFRKVRHDDLDTQTNRYGRRFTVLVLLIAVGSALGWLFAGQAGRGLKAFISVLIVACPCALALAAPFALGTAQRWLARAGLFLKNALTLEHLARIQSIVFDKTGTLTATAERTVVFHGPALDSDESRAVLSLARQSIHPLAARVADSLAPGTATTDSDSFAETPGRGIEGRAGGFEVRLGSRALLEAGNVTVPDMDLPAGSAVWLALNGTFRGVFVIANRLRPETTPLLQRLQQHHDLALVSGDNDRDRGEFLALFGSGRDLLFNQSPVQKLQYVRDLQARGRTVMMVGDGLNDAGALQQADVGVAVVEQAGGFSPASDVILESANVPVLAGALDLAVATRRIVRWCFGISAAYNAVGVAIAAGGWLSPVICAILMPLSSVTVVLFACGATTLAARRRLRFPMRE